MVFGFFMILAGVALAVVFLYNLMFGSGWTGIEEIENPKEFRKKREMEIIAENRNKTIAANKNNNPQVPPERYITATKTNKVKLEPTKSQIADDFVRHIERKGIGVKKVNQEDHIVVVINYDAGITKVDYVTIHLVFRGGETPRITASNILKLNNNINIDEFEQELDTANRKNEKEMIPIFLNHYNNQLFVEHLHYGVGIYVNEPYAIEERIEQLLYYIRDAVMPNIRRV